MDKNLLHLFFIVFGNAWVKGQLYTILSNGTKKAPISYGPRLEKTCLPGFVNNKDTDQTARMHSLIRRFVIRLLESIISTTCYKLNFDFLASICS